MFLENRCYGLKKECIEDITKCNVKNFKLMLTAWLTLNLEFVNNIADPPMPQTPIKPEQYISVSVSRFFLGDLPGTSA